MILHTLVVPVGKRIALQQRQTALNSSYREVGTQTWIGLALFFSLKNSTETEMCKVGKELGQ